VARDVTFRDLSQREISILRLYPVHGYYQGIADELGLSRNTVKNEVGGILRKLDCASLGQAALLYDRWQRAERVGP
jgi:DNA-binding NarL/FixJ family response regulator